MDLNIDFLFKVVLSIVLIGLSIKAIKFISSMLFKVALILFVILFIYQVAV